jgi:Phospholipase_D-nuclease N-terminal
VVRTLLHACKRRCSVGPVRILLIVVVALFLVLWVAAVIDVLRRRDVSGIGKLGWVVGMLVFPVVGLGVYTLFRAARA